MICGELIIFELYEIFKFISEWVVMSVIVWDLRDNKIKIFIKGVDGKIFKLLKKLEKESKIMEEIEKYLLEFFKRGLWILVCVYKIIDDDEFLLWMVKYKWVKVIIWDRELVIEKFVKIMESDLLLIGVIVIEDKL